MSLSAKDIIKLSISRDSKERLAFARKIAELCQMLAPDAVRLQLLPFIIDWVDLTDEVIIYTVANQVIYLAIRMGGIGFASPLIMHLLTSQNKLVRVKLTEQILKFKDDATAFQFMNAMVRSVYDSVRSFVPKVVNILSSQKDIQTVLLHLTSDKTFAVKRAVLESLVNQEPETAKLVAVQMLDDLDDKIRSFISSATIKFPFWTSSLLPRLENDPSWRVRASIAAQSVNCVVLTPVLPSLYRLTKDPSWEVRLITLRTISSILFKKPDITFQETSKLLEDISKNFQKSQQKSTLIAYIDVVISLICSSANRLEDSVWSPIVDSILNIQNSQVRLHFFIVAAQQNISAITPLISEKFMRNLPSFMNDKKWRVREEAAKHLLLFRTYFSNPDIVSFIDSSAMTFMNDETLPVKVAASKFIAQTSPVSTENPIPAYVKELMTVPSFRKRQNAVMILNELRSFTTNPAVKHACEEKLKELQSDKVELVAGFAKNPIIH